MKINTLKIKNFRGIPDMEISLERISFFTGPCGAGKTSVLKAFNFALTGDVKKDDIREQSDRASATIVFEDQSSIQRICKQSAPTQVKVNGKIKQQKQLVSSCRQSLEHLRIFSRLCARRTFLRFCHRRSRQNFFCQFFQQKFHLKNCVSLLEKTIKN